MKFYPHSQLINLTDQLLVPETPLLICWSGSVRLASAGLFSPVAVLAGWSGTAAGEIICTTVTILILSFRRDVWANSVNPDQTTPEGAV